MSARDDSDYENYRVSKQARMVARACLERMKKFTKQTKTAWHGDRGTWRTVYTDNDIGCGDCDHKKLYTRLANQIGGHPDPDHCMCFNLDTGYPCSHITAKEISNLNWSGWIEYIPEQVSQCEYEAHTARRAND